jgi:serine/threonine protein kinase/predicted ATPase
MNLIPGTTVGPYIITSRIGAGGMGEVYRARDSRLERQVALKVIRRALVAHEDALDRLLREATLASALNHPNIVTIYETGTVRADRYIAMELVEGTTLRDLASEGLALERLLGVARQVAEALAVAHAAKIVHRDVKPENVMVRPDGYVKLLDFGLARVYAPAVAALTGPATEAGLVLGTLAYMAPEQARGETAGPEADIFALGVLLYELTAGRHPFTTGSQLGTLHALMSESPEPPSLLNPELPRAIDQLILEMLQKDARLRPGASEVMYRLNVVHDSSVAAVLSSVVATQPRSHSTGDVVGREVELDALLNEFEGVRRGRGRLVVISGEAGMGKTTLMEAFTRMLDERHEPVRIGRGRCSERLAGSEAYLPVLEALESLQRSEQHGSITRLIRTLAPNWYVQISPAAGTESTAVPVIDACGGSQERLKREIAALLDEASRVQPVVLCFDDVHWADPSTTDLLGYLARRLDSMRLLICATVRPSDLVQARHPFGALKLDLVARGVGRELTPGLLDEVAVTRYLARMFPEHAFPAAFIDVLCRRTEGHPMFLADLLRDLRRRHVLRQQGGRWILDADLASVERALPESVKSMVQRKIDALDDDDRQLLRAASVQGLDFDSGVLAAALDRPGDEIEDRLERLEREHALVRFVNEAELPDRTFTLWYRFAHHMYQNAFYASLRANRRAALSRAIAEQLVRRLGDQPCECAAGIALLFETARDGVRAAEFFNQAAQAAARLYAHDEMARLAKHGLAALEQEAALPDNAAGAKPRAAAELALQMTYGLAVKTSEGYAVPEVGQAYGRARELCREVEDPARVVPVLIGLSAHHVVSGEIRTAHEIALEMLALFDRLGDRNLQMIGEWSLGAALFHLGSVVEAHQHLLRGVELHDPAFHRARVWETGIEPGIFCRCELSRTLMLLGHPDEALACAEAAVASARSLPHAQPLAFALLFRTFAHLERREPAAVLETYDELAALCRAHGIAQEMQWAAPLRGRALVDLGDAARGLAAMRDGLAAHTISRSALLRPYYFILYAEALLRAGYLEDAHEALAEAAAVAAETGQHAYDAEHGRVQAEVLADRGQAAAAEHTYREALAMAQGQQTRWLELRVARAYAEFLTARGRRAEAETLTLLR